MLRVMLRSLLQPFASRVLGHSSVKHFHEPDLDISCDNVGKQRLVTKRDSFLLICIPLSEKFVAVSKYNFMYLFPGVFYYLQSSEPSFKNLSNRTY